MINSSDALDVFYFPLFPELHGSSSWSIFKFIFREYGMALQQNHLGCLRLFRREANRLKRYKIAIFLLCLLAGGASSGLAAADKIEWHTYQSGTARSGLEKKKVFLHFYADWCSYCAEMERKTFQNPAVIAMLNRNFIPIRVDSDREKEIAALFRVKGLPDSWCLAENGDIIGHRPGFIPAEQLLAILNVVMGGK